ncbi:hypothetical protein SAMN05216358_0082 [Rhizobium sp. AN5]|uniref:hypothetical protein n=1 Tax=Rhizobium sp. AN5 TaxID=1855304 RepID=UPI000BDDB842|nr:hypothetical protein [Rhizobium sp. AN5]SOC90063.1 hypothetical protein SAMN05216358_0082 [Rhizobium sp. AN5]
MYFYSDTAPRAHSDIDVWKMNGSEAYLRHYSNYLFLNFVAVKGTREERASVEKEILICERKLKFWERHPKFDAAYVQGQKEKLIKQWRQDAAGASGKTSAP